MIDSLIEAARLAKLTNPPKPASETALSKQLAEVQSAVKKLALKWDCLTTAPVSDRPEQLTTEKRSPSHRRRVSFNVPRDTGCSTVVVKRSLVSDDQLTGAEQTCVLIDNTVRRTPVAEIEIETPYYTGKVTAVCMRNPL